MDDKIIPLGSFVPYFYSPDNDSFSMQIGGTVYEGPPILIQRAKKPS